MVLVLVEQEGEETSEGSSVSGSGSSINIRPGPILFARETIALVEKTIPGTASINDKIKRLVDMNKKLRQQVEETEQALYARRQRHTNDPYHQTANGNANDELQRDAAKQLAELKLKLQETERQNTTHQGDLIRMEGQLKRYKTTSEQTEKECTELKTQNRTLKKELRDKENALDEAKENNKHLQQRLEKLRNSRRGFV
ncbi:Leucine-rich repeat flightless-interacting protein [Aphelenchoides avenae]|nr:Leucine-rich repeat flightless-interacting protein [Aphelenchus avenae]